jgi:hypothetical protein
MIDRQGTTGNSTMYQTAMEVDMEPPAYEEAWTSGDPPGMQAQPCSKRPTTAKKNESRNRWANDCSADTFDVQW